MEELLQEVERLRVVEDALRDSGITVDENLVVNCAFKQSAGYSAMRQLLELANPPRAVFAGSNLLTLGALQAIHERDLAIPDGNPEIVFERYG